MIDIEYFDKKYIKDLIFILRILDVLISCTRVRKPTKILLIVNRVA